MADNVLLVVDVVEGLTGHCKNLIEMCLKEGKKMILVLNKMDRLVLELKLPPADAYQKIKHVMDEVNVAMQSFATRNQGERPYFSPLHENVIFACTEFKMCFTLEMFATLYRERQMTAQGLQDKIGARHGAQMRSQKNVLDAAKFAKFLWGDIYYNRDTRKFSRKASSATQRSFVHFILEPFYKLVSLTLTKDKADLKVMLKLELGLVDTLFKAPEYDLDIKQLLILVLSRTFGNSSKCLVDKTITIFESAHSSNPHYVDLYYQNTITPPELIAKLKKGDPKGPLCISILKHQYNEIKDEFECLARIISGTVKKGEQVRVLGEKFNPDEQEDMSVQTVKGLFLMQEGGRYRIEVDQIGAGNWIFISGIDQSISKTATVWDISQNPEEIETFRKVDFGTTPVIKVACEPLNPSDLPKMVEGLRKVVKSYPICETKVEESGEHIIIGTGELYMDSVFLDLRKIFTPDIEIKVSEPFVSIAETVGDMSSVKCVCETPNKKNKIGMVAQPLDKGLQEKIEYLAGNFADIQTILKDEFKWDDLTADNVWAFGPHGSGPNMMVDYSLEHETDKKRLSSVQNSIVQGF